MSKTKNEKLIDAFNLFKEKFVACGRTGNSLAAQAMAAQQSFALAMMEMGSASPQDAFEPARRGIVALTDLREVLRQQLVTSQGLISATDTLIAEFTNAVEKHQK
jgi:hypothetical protein